MTDVELAASPVAADVASLSSLDRESQELAVTQMLSQARQWLVRAVDFTAPVQDVAEFKAFVATVAEAAKQKKLSEGIQLDALEMVRRSERALGVAVREGQEAGEIVRIGQIGGTGKAAPGTRSSVAGDLVSPSQFFTSGQERAETYTMTDLATGEVFDEVLAEAKDEGNLSRANVVRKVKERSRDEERDEQWADVEYMAGNGFTSEEINSRLGMFSELRYFRAAAKTRGIKFPSDVAVAGRRRIDFVAVIEKSILSIDVATSDLSTNGLDITPEQASQWLTELAEPIKALTRFKKELKEISND